MDVESKDEYEMAWTIIAAFDLDWNDIWRMGHGEFIESYVKATMVICQ